MNQFVVLSALLAVAAAAPSADPYLLYAHPFVSAHAKTADLVTHPNGAVVPSDTVSVQAARLQHLAAKTLYGYPYAHYIGKREAEPSAEADPYLLYGVAPAVTVVANPALPVAPVVDPVSGQRQVKFGNGAFVPEEPLAVQLARGAHLTTKALTYAARGYYGLPLTHHLVGKREAESNPEADPYLLYAGYHHPYITSVGGLTTYSNGAVVPTNTPAVQAATVNHLVAKAGVYAAHGYGYHLLGKRDAESKAEADPYLLYGLYNHYPLITSVGGLTTYTNGAVVPTNPALLAAEAKHFAAKGLIYG